jgi:WD40 repeat protein
MNGWQEGGISRTEQEIEVAPQPGLKLLPVSARLKRTLMHPNKQADLVGVRYLPDGKRVIAGDYPGGIVQIWDSATGKQLTRIDTGESRRMYPDFFCSRDSKTLYVARGQIVSTLIDKSSDRVRYKCSGQVGAWNLDTGKLQQTLKHDPPRGIVGMALAPTGSVLATFEWLSGETTSGPKTAASLWDLKTGKHCPLGGGLGYWSVFSPDGKTLAAPADAEGGRRNAVKLFDVATAKLRKLIPIAGKGLELGFIAYSPDGKTLAGQVRSRGQDWLKLWDAATGQEIASFAGARNDHFMAMTFSSNGQTLAVSNARRDRAKIFLFDVPGCKLVKTVLLAENAMARAVAFGPDDRWIAATTQSIPLSVAVRQPNALDLPQPRIHLIHVGLGGVQETFVAPQGIAASLCFSPDGKTLASGGHGRVLLWDVTGLPKDTSSRSEVR